MKNNTKFTKDKRNNYNNGKERNNTNSNFKKKPYEPMKQKKFRSFYNDFNEGILALLEVVPDILTLVPNNRYSIDDIKDNSDIMYDLVTDLVEAHGPYLISGGDKEDRIWEFKMSANKVFVKTPNFYSFGWSIKSIRTPDGSRQKSYAFFVTLYGNGIDVLSSQLDSYGWEEYEDQKPSR